MLKEFKEFALKGNLIDTAVAFVMGAAFATVSTAFVSGIFMPLVALVFQMDDVNSMKIILKPAVIDAAGKVTTPENAIMYGAFIGAILNFIVIAFVMFLLVRYMNRNKVEPLAEVSSTDAILNNILEALKK